jgi:starvation-inducible outer membrane lipoprotein
MIKYIRSLIRKGSKMKKLAIAGIFTTIAFTLSGCATPEEKVIKELKESQMEYVEWLITRGKPIPQSNLIK